MSSVTAKGDHLQYPNVHLEAQGSLIALARTYKLVTRPHVYGRRGEITHFSAGSRRRLIRQLARLQPGRTTFLTLTYPDEFPSPHDAKLNLYAMLERFRRRWPRMSAVWRMEYQKRGAPHFHLLAFNMPFLPFVTLRRWWAEVIGLPEGEYAFVRIELVKSQRGVMYYASKYVAKTDDEGGSALFNYGTYLHAGRFWGVFNRAFLPLAVRVYAKIPQVTPVAFRQIKELFAQFWHKIEPRAPNGVVLFHHDVYNLYLEALGVALRDCPYCSRLAG